MPQPAPARTGPAGSRTQSVYILDGGAPSPGLGPGGRVLYAPGAQAVQGMQSMQGGQSVSVLTPAGAPVGAPVAPYPQAYAQAYPQVYPLVYPQARAQVYAQAAPSVHAQPQPVWLQSVPATPATPVTPAAQAEQPPLAQDVAGAVHGGRQTAGKDPEKSGKSKKAKGSKEAKGAKGAKAGKSSEASGSSKRSKPSKSSRRGAAGIALEEPRSLATPSFSAMAAADNLRTPGTHPPSRSDGRVRRIRLDPPQSSMVGIWPLTISSVICAVELCVAFLDVIMDAVRHSSSESMSQLATTGMLSPLVINWHITWGIPFAFALSFLENTLRWALRRKRCNLFGSLNGLIFAVFLLACLYTWLWANEYQAMALICKWILIPFGLRITPEEMAAVAYTPEIKYYVDLVTCWSFPAQCVLVFVDCLISMCRKGRAQPVFIYVKVNEEGKIMTKLDAKSL